MTNRIDKAGLQVSAELATFIDERVLPAAGIKPDAFWTGAAGIFATFAPKNRALLTFRDKLQGEIDAWHQARAGKPVDGADNTKPSCARSATSCRNPRRSRAAVSF